MTRSQDLKESESSDFAAPALLGDLVTLQVPGIVHHELEVVVSVNAHGDVVVVLDPLIDGDSAVTGVLLVV